MVSRTFDVSRESSLLFFNDTATTEIYTLSLHDALPISDPLPAARRDRTAPGAANRAASSGAVPCRRPCPDRAGARCHARSEEHTSELQSRQYLVCRLLLEKKTTLAAATLLAGLRGVRVC